MKKPVIVPLIQLNQEPYSSVLCFPKPSRLEIESRLSELQTHGVTALEFYGETNVYRVPVPVLGKGYVGIVVIAHLEDERVALKIRRVDADRENLLHEAEMLQKANSANVGPKFVAASGNFLLSQLIDGDLLPAWLHKANEQAVVKKVLTDVLEDCFRLDGIGLDHGELSKAPKHVIVDRADKPWILDFETASDKRKPANVSAICHFLFTSPGEVATTIAERIGTKDKNRLIEALRNYRKSITRQDFELVLQACLR